MTENQEAISTVNAEIQEGKNCQYLNNYAGKRRLGKVTYENQDQTLPDNSHLWTSTVQLDGTTYGQGQASTKVEAKGKAAKKALAALKAKFGSGPDDGHYD